MTAPLIGCHTRQIHSFFSFNLLLFLILILISYFQLSSLFHVHVWFSVESPSQSQSNLNFNRTKTCEMFHLTIMASREEAKTNQSKSSQRIRHTRSDVHGGAINLNNNSFYILFFWSNVKENVLDISCVCVCCSFPL